MKKRLTLYTLLTTLFLIILNIGVYAEYEIKTIYFKPNNVNNVPIQKLRNAMLEIQELYKEEMDRNGYGDKTFELERKADGNVKINVINGNQPSWIYQSNTWDNIKPEVPEVFQDQKNIHVFVIGGIDTINDWLWGSGWSINNFNFGGTCIVAENANTSLVRLIAHEIGHTFSLSHTGDANTIMGRGHELLPYEARWLHKHYFFNPNRRILWQHPTIDNILSVKETERDIINLKIHITSPNNLHQIVIMDSNILVIGWQYINGNNINADIKIDRHKLLGKNRITCRVMDTFGAFTLKTFNYTMPPRLQIPEEDKPVVVINQEDLENEKETKLNVNIKKRYVTLWAKMKRR